LSDSCPRTNPQTPNHILEIEDIPARHDQKYMLDNVRYPTTSRYTWQWLAPDADDKTVMPDIPNNCDASFRKDTKRPKPSDLLLHYNYGAAAVKCWGQGKRILQDLANPPRPDVSRNRGGAVAKSAGAGTGGLAESEGQAVWDEDDVMLFFMRNSRAAKERHLKEVGENTQRVEQWRDGVPQ